MPTARITIDAPRSLHTALKRGASKAGLPMAEYVRRAISEKLKTQPFTSLPETSMSTTDKRVLAGFSVAVLICLSGAAAIILKFATVEGHKIQAAALPQRFTMAKDSGGTAFDTYTITDTQTGNAYLVARTSGGVAIAPLLP